MKKLFIFIVSLIILASLVSSLGIAELPVVRSGNCFTVQQSCSNCSYVKITTVQYPNGTMELLDYSMTNFVGSSWGNSSFCNSQLTGEYIFGTEGDPNGILTSQPISILVNYQGKAYEVIDGLIYIGVIFILIVIFIIGLYSSIAIPFNNPVNELNQIIKIDYKKHVKLFAITMTYITFVALTYFAWNLSFGILEFPELAQWFYVLFRISFVIMLGFIPVAFVIGLVKAVKDNKLKTLLERGLTIK